MRMHWPADGSSADLEITGAGYHHLPYDRLWLTDDHGLRYQVTFDGEGGTASWRGVARLYPAPAPEARWLDLIADGTERLIRLERWQVSPAERLLAVEAEAMLAAAWNRPGHTMDPHLGEIVTTLAEAGLLAADSPVAGQLAALCQRLGVPAAGIAGPGIAGRAAAELPARWASVLARRPADAAGPAGLAGTAGPEVFAPLATVLPDLEGTRFALAGLSVAAGESFLHVVASGMPALTGRFTFGWHPGFSWWVRAGNGPGNERGASGWHVAVIADPADRFAGEAEFRLRLVPPLTLPLAGPLDTIEVEVSGGSGRVRAVVPVRGGPGMADT
jgi:hypothetical protein